MDEISRLKQVGVALGVDPYGTASGAFTRGLLVKTFNCNPVQNVAPVPEIRSKLDTRRVTKGVLDYAAALEFALDVGDAASAGVGDFLGSVYGAEAGSLVAGKYKHKFTIGQTGNPSWLNLWSDKDKTPKQYLGFMPASVKFAIDAKEAIVPVTVEGALQNEAALGAQTLVFSDEPLVSPQVLTTVKIGGASVTNLESGEITVKREQEPIHFLGNSRVIGELVSGKTFGIDLSLTGINFADETERAKFLAVGTTSLELKFTDANSNYIHFMFPEVYYSTFDGPELSDSDVLRLNLAGLVTGDSANHFIEIQNSYSKRYDTGATIV